MAKQVNPTPPSGPAPSINDQKIKKAATKAEQVVNKKVVNKKTK